MECINNVGTHDCSTVVGTRWTRARRLFLLLGFLLHLAKVQSTQCIPETFMGLSPKNCLVYQLYRDAQAAKIYFETGLMRTYANTRSITRSDYPFTVCNRFYQQEIMIDEGIVGTGRETPLTGLIDTDLHS